MRRFLSFSLGLAMVAGLMLALWPVGQSIYGRWNQHALSAQWQAQQNRDSASKSRAVRPSSRAENTRKGHTNGQGARLTSAVPQHDIDSPAPAVATNESRKVAPWPLTKLSIPQIGLETFIVQGMDSAALRRGPGHDAASSLPGRGNCVVAGHRNTYGAFFYRLDELTPGATVLLENRDGKFSYTASAVFNTPDTDLTVLQSPPPGATPLLTLITCTLPHSNQRLVLQATLDPDPQLQ